MANEGVELVNFKAQREVKKWRKNELESRVIYTVIDTFYTGRMNSITRTQYPLIYRPWTPGYKRLKGRWVNSSDLPLMDEELPRYYGNAWPYLQRLKIHESPQTANDDLKRVIIELQNLEKVEGKKGCVGLLKTKMLILKDYIDTSSEVELETAAVDPRIAKRIAETVMKINLEPFLSMGGKHKTQRVRHRRRGHSLTRGQSLKKKKTRR